MTPPLAILLIVERMSLQRVAFKPELVVDKASPFGCGAITPTEGDGSLYDERLLHCPVHKSLITTLPVSAQLHALA